MTTAPLRLVLTFALLGTAGASSSDTATALVRAASSVCVAVPGATPGDTAVLNITNTRAAANGFGSLRASNATPVFDRQPTDQFSSVNFAANTPPNPNLAFTLIGPDNQICYDGAGGNHDVILDLAATIPATNITTIDPQRILDTRTTTNVSAGSSVCVAVPGATPGDTAVLNITNTRAAANGFGSLRASNATPVFDRQPTDQFSSVNFAANTPPNPNLAFTLIGPDNQICYDGAGGNHDVILDLAATIPATNITTIDPQRILDTRTTTNVSAGSSVCVAVPGATPGDTAVLNITNTRAAANGFGSLRASNATPVFDRQPTDQFSSVNFAANTPPNPNLAFTLIGPDNQICYDGAGGNHDVILDLAATIPATNITTIDPQRILDTRTVAACPSTADALSILTNNQIFSYAERTFDITCQGITAEGTAASGSFQFGFALLFAEERWQLLKAGTWELSICRAVWRYEPSFDIGCGTSAADPDPTFESAFDLFDLSETWGFDSIDTSTNTAVIRRWDRRALEIDGWRQLETRTVRISPAFRYLRLANASGNDNTLEQFATWVNAPNQRGHFFWIARDALGAVDLAAVAWDTTGSGECVEISIPPLDDNC